MSQKVTLYASAAISFLANVDGFISLFQRIFNHDKNTAMTTNTQLWLQIIGIFVTFIIAYFLLSRVEKLRKELRANTAINYIRTKRAFIKSFGNTQFNRLPGETDEQYYQRVPDGGLLEKELLDQYYECREILMEESGGTIDKVTINALKKHFPENFTTNEPH